MVRIADAILPQGTPGELIEVLEAIIAVLNNGRYQTRSLSSAPTEDAGDGETAFHVAASDDKKFYIYDKTNQVWEEVLLARNVQSTEAAGIIKMWAGDEASPPEGYLICDGSAASRTDYADLFDAIGTTFGSGDGSTTFNLPNIDDRFVMGNGATVGGLGVTGGDLTGSGTTIRTATASDSTQQSPDGSDGSNESEADHSHKYPKYISMNFIIKT